MASPATITKPPQPTAVAPPPRRRGRRVPVLAVLVGVVAPLGVTIGVLAMWGPVALVCALGAVGGGWWLLTTPAGRRQWPQSYQADAAILAATTTAAMVASAGAVALPLAGVGVAALALTLRVARRRRQIRRGQAGWFERLADSLQSVCQLELANVRVLVAWHTQKPPDAPALGGAVAWWRHYRDLADAALPISPARIELRHLPASLCVPKIALALGHHFSDITGMDWECFPDPTRGLQRLEPSRLPSEVPYPRDYPHQEQWWRVPLGVSRRFTLVVWDLLRHTHLQIQGGTGGGKTNLLRILLRHLLTAGRTPAGHRRFTVWLADPKIVSLRWFKRFKNRGVRAYGNTIEDIAVMIRKFHDAMMDRFEDMEKLYGDDLDDDMCKAYVEQHGHHVLILDELTAMFLLDKLKDEVTKALDELREASKGYCSKVGMQGREAGFHLVLAGQRLDHVVFPGNLKVNIPATIVLGSTTREGSQIAVASSDAAQLLGAGISGRAVWRTEYGGVGTLEKLQTFRITSIELKEALDTLEPDDPPPEPDDPPPPDAGADRRQPAGDGPASGNLVYGGQLDGPPHGGQPRLRLVHRADASKQEPARPPRGPQP